MNTLTDFSMKNASAIFIIVLLLIAGGGYSATTLKVENMPDISFPVVTIATPYTAPPKDVLELVTKPLEKSVARLEGLTSLSSVSQDGYSQIDIRLEPNKISENVRVEVERLIANVKLPLGAEKPAVLTRSIASDPVYYLAVYGEEGTGQAELDAAYKATILPAFEGLNGFDHADSFGTQEAALAIKLDAWAINSYGLTPPRVSDLIREGLVSSSAGKVDFDGNNQMVRVKGQLDSIYNLENMKIPAPGGDTLLLKQIAKVEVTNELPTIVRLDSKPAIGVLLYKTKEANTVQFAASLTKLIAGWETSSKGFKIHTVLNGAASVNESVHGMIQESVLGAVMASLMILLYIRNWRMTLIVLVSIPLSILITLLLMNPLGVSLNMMTLGGMAIAIGRVVDDSIVVIESIYSQLQKAQEQNESVIRLATRQVASAITSSTLTTVGVFAPIGLVSGVVGEVFRPFALTLICALLASLLVALTVIPLLVKLMVLKGNSLSPLVETKAGLYLSDYRKALLWSLNNRMKTLLFSAILFVLSIVLAIPNLAISFMPTNVSEKQMVFNVRMPYEASLELTNAVSREIESLLKEAKDAAGSPIFKYNEPIIGHGWADIYTEADPKLDTLKVFKEYREKIKKQLPQDYKVNGKVFAVDGAGSEGVDFAYLLTGDDPLYLQQAAKQVEAIMQTFPELHEIKNGLSDTRTEVEVTVDQNKARLYGFTVSQVLETVKSWLKEDELGDLKFDQVTYTTKVMLDNKYKNSLDKLGSILLEAADGKRVQINDIAWLKQIDAPAIINREMQSQVLYVTAKINSNDKGGVSNKLSAELAKLELPLGVSREIKGVAGEINKSFKEMFLAMAASILFVYLIMVLTFGNTSAPLAILFTLPLAAIGGLLGLLVTGESVNVTSLIGFLMLIGIVVTNAIVLIDRAQQLIRQGLSIRESLIEAGMTRLKPILMTASATVMALLPLALGFSKGALVSKGLAVVVIGGLTTSTLLTLVVVPIMYELLHSMIKKRASSKWTRM
ncbi:efflux RND transporter permease subunit [Paenibacillus periandrae]|uniref:efflux RND transporter permease subunit n=1 Tax=Paenibacillus periandrae TaxID=1761741 RepID=UPI001F08C7B9|nr:efflux RND transporter permease subunit [Paenibacillus periandrae]